MQVIMSTCLPDENTRELKLLLAFFGLCCELLSLAQDFCSITVNKAVSCYFETDSLENEIFINNQYTSLHHVNK